MGAQRSLGDSFHVESHAALLESATEADISGRTLDAIVVPTIRPRHLGEAVRLASELGCSLVVLCTTSEQANRAMIECRAVIDNLLVTYLPASVIAKHLASLTSAHPESGIAASCHVDIARKRNLGILLARLCGWRTIMYLDDDIRGLSSGGVSRAASLTPRFHAVGFQVSSFPDNSVVCHAYRLAGGQQGTFPGGCALLVDVERYTGLFPAIYNEDWLFLFDAVQKRSISVVGTLSQLEYQPFARPQRAASEEFGDVIAEGLYALLHQGADMTDATSQYWQGVLERRLRLIDHIVSRLSLLGGQDPAVIGSALTSLAAARQRLTSLSLESCVSFIHAWRTDLDMWGHRLLGLPVVSDLALAAKHLELPVHDGRVRR